MKYRVIRPFGYHRVLEVGSIVDFNDDEANRYSHLIQAVEDSNFIDNKPHRKYNKGRKK